MSKLSLEDCIDLARYPIGDDNSAARQSLLSLSRLRLKDDGALTLPGFLTKQTVARLIEEVNTLKTRGHRMQGEYSPYSDNLSEPIDPHDNDHPRRYRLPASHTFIAGDLIDVMSPIRQIYYHADFIRFIADLLETREIYTVTDPMGCINYLVYQQGDCNGWHFDTTEFVISLALQLSEKGGQYEYIPNLRSANDENLPAVRHRMQQPDDPAGVKTVDLETGTLFLFKGLNTMHRVTEISGASERIMTILSFHRQPGHLLSPGSRMAMYGRES